jgi:hypothetical protein
VRERKVKVRRLWAYGRREKFGCAKLGAECYGGRRWKPKRRKVERKKRGAAVCRHLPEEALSVKRYPD